MTIRVRLMIAAIAIILVANVLHAWFTLAYVQRIWFSELQTRVELNLNSARAAYSHSIERLHTLLRAASLDTRVHKAVEKGDLAGLHAFLQDLQDIKRTDIIAVLDAQGRVLQRARMGANAGDSLLHNAVVAEAMQRGISVAGTVVVPAQDLEAEGEDLAAQARFELLSTEGAVPTRDLVRGEGMMLAAAVPLWDETGQLVGTIYGANLLNRRYELVDSIRDQVFARQIHQGRQVGTVTVFQRDLRIATNVETREGGRAVGTRMSAAVYDEVLIKGNAWAAPAFVVNDWYITAYEPIHDPRGDIVGALYVGLLRAPFIQQRNVLSAVFLIGVSGAMILILILLFIMTKIVLRPIGQIIAMHQKIIAGDLTARVGIRPAGEMGDLCRAVDSMAEAVERRESRLKKATETQMSRSEKLATIGRLAAGVAHEINNPLTGVLSFAHLLREKTNMDDQDREDLDLIIHETKRVSEIVRGLLDFSREGPSLKAPLDVNEVVERTLRLLSNQKVMEHFNIEKQLAPNLPAVNADSNQLQQVFLNIALNAGGAMRPGGTMTIATEAKAGEVVVTIRDTGIGIPREHLEHIFDPFFSTKPVGKGTGLGLSVSFGIIQRHGGTIEVESEEGKGTTVSISLPSSKWDNSQDNGTRSGS